MSVPFDSIRIKNRIREGLEKAYAEADPVLLNRYRALFKKEVSLFRRSYAAAYFLMELDQGGPRYSPERGRAGSAVRGGRGGFRYEGKSGEGAGSGAATLPEEESTRLFFGAGRSRRVFPRELLGLILSRTMAVRDDVGLIRILDNYSFVQVRSSVAEEIIKALNGKSFRGRPLTVNYARDRKTSEAENGGENGGVMNDGVMNDDANYRDAGNDGSGNDYGGALDEDGIDEDYGGEDDDGDGRPEREDILRAAPASGGAGDGGAGNGGAGNGEDGDAQGTAG
ncbi:MAG: DbpA RNA binding domain-containing protein [Spirochaetaceae bacterium]|jgi:hypothetical protein|nr:DbpA RNA binding domain-containing protein [Spirochaetaceae bacterium]